MPVNENLDVGNIYPTCMQWSFIFPSIPGWSFAIHRYPCLIMTMDRANSSI